MAACAKTPPPPPPPLPVRLLAVGAGGAATADATFPGVVTARVESELSFQVGGRLITRAVSAGTRVGVGQAIAALDTRDLRLAADAAEAQAAATAVQAANAARELARIQELARENIPARAEVDQRQTAAAAARAQVAAVRAQLATARDAVRYGTLRAPGAGVITATMADVGQVLAPGQPVARFAEAGTRDVVVDLPEGRLAIARLGTRVRVRLGADTAAGGSGRASGGGDETAVGRVREVAAAADPVTRTYRVRVAVEGSAPATRGAATGGRASSTPLTLGRTASVTFAEPSTAGVALPRAALTTRPGAGDSAPGVWVLPPNADHVRWATVRLGRATADSAIVVAGLAPGDRVVVAGAHRLDSTLRVRPWDGTMP